MIRVWIETVKNCDRETKVFYLNAFVYTAVLVLTTIYCYARLDYVRSTKPDTTIER